MYRIHIKINNKFKFTVVYKIRSTAGLTCIRAVAALFDHADNIQKPAKLPDCSPGIVTQPTDSRLSKTSNSNATKAVIGTELHRFNESQQVA